MLEGRSRENILIALYIILQNLQNFIFGKFKVKCLFPSYIYIDVMRNDYSLILYTHTVLL